MIKRALIIKQNTPGQSFTDIAEWLNNLAELHYRKGNYNESRVLQQRSLDIHTKTFGQNHVHGSLSVSSK